MCCHCAVRPYDPLIAEAILRLGMFEQVPSTSLWTRHIWDENTAVSAHQEGDALVLTLAPVVASFEGHAHKRIAASVMYEIACRYAQKVNGTITQEAINVAECRLEGPTRTLAVYPETRFDYSMLCAGFREAFRIEE